MKITIKGVEELESALAKIGSMSIVRDVVKVNTSEMQKKAQRLAPVDSGNLKRSIGLEFSGSGFTGKVGSIVEYGPYLEKGTRFQSPQPFMTPAGHAQAVKFKSDLTRLMDAK